MRIKRLKVAQRIQARLHIAEAKMMHIVDENHINMPVRTGRYNIRQKDGSIRKVTLFDSVAFVDTIKKIGGKYINMGREVISEIKAKNIK